MKKIKYLKELSFMDLFYLKKGELWDSEVFELADLEDANNEYLCSYYVFKI